jgi:hypothetical protein
LALLLLLMLALLVLALPGVAQGPDYEFMTYKVAGGGQTHSTAEGYVLGSTMGQADAGALESEDYVLSGGFWGGGVPVYKLYLPLMLLED